MVIIKFFHHAIITKKNRLKDVILLEYRRKIAVVYTLEEALQKLNEIRQHGFFEHEIHIFTKKIAPFHSLKMNTEIHVHQAGNVLDQLLAVAFRMKQYEVCLRKFQFSQEELYHYGELIRKNAIFIIAQHDYPFEKQNQRAFQTAPRLIKDK